MQIGEWLRTCHLPTQDNKESYVVFFLHIWFVRYVKVIWMDLGFVWIFLIAEN